MINLPIYNRNWQVVVRLRFSMHYVAFVKKLKIISCLLGISKKMLESVEIIQKSKFLKLASLYQYQVNTYCGLNTINEFGKTYSFHI